ncbi:MAG: hypothetical protein AMJ55_02970 [Gammaproteobacteria bacterium SG8_15]|nr:MAG: hypothetical protein AMJ55_02970 [Gammaproteobacteria bacterium SG8_15]
MADVLKKQMLARLHLTKNGRTLYDQRFDSETSDFAEFSQHRAVLATNMAIPEEIDLEGVDTGTMMALLTDQQIKVSVDSNTYQWTVSEFVMLSGSFTHVYVQNESTTNTATIEVVVVDDA